MSILNDVFGLGRSSVTESFYDDNIEPEIRDMTLENAADIDDDPMDYMMQVAYENEINMKNIDMAIIAEEYCYLRENGQELVYEATSISTIIEKFKQAVKNLWSRIQSFFKKVLKDLKEKINLDKRFLDKYGKRALKGGTGVVKGNSNLFNIDAAVSSMETTLGDLKDESDSIYERLVKDETLQVDKEWKRILKNIFKETAKENKVRGNYTEKDVMNAWLKSGSETKSDEKAQPFEAKKAIAAFKKSDALLQKLKKTYDKNKEVVNSHLKAAKTMEANAKKFKVLPTDQSKAIHGGITILNKIGSTMTLVDRAAVKLVHRSRAFCKAVIVAAASKTVDVKKESASFIDDLELL